MNSSKRVRTSQEISQLKEFYDTIYEENQSYRESLLVSPHCSKYQRNSPKGHSTDKSLSDYIRPFEKQAINRTQTKQKPPRRNQKTTLDHLSEGLTENKNVQSLSDLVFSLRKQISDKDKRIIQLEESISRLTSRNIMKTSASYRGQSPEHANTANSPLKQNKHSKNKSKELIKGKDDEKETNFRKQIIFLTKNNQQLYEEIKKFQDENKKIKSFLSQTLEYSQQLQKTLQKVKIMNRQLLSEKQAMMKNYKDEIKLFKKMKQVHEEKFGTKDQVECVCKCSKVQSHKNLHKHIKNKN